MGSRILYYLVILPISSLPFFTLYALSDFLYLILYKLIGYRTKVVSANIRNSFPEKSPKEIKQIEAKFYSHLCDVVVESIKAFTISEKEASKRMKHINLDVANQFKKEGKHVVMAGGHYNNWELFAMAIGGGLESKAIALFTPLTNKFFNNKIKTSRSKYGLNMLPIAEIRSELESELSVPSTIIFGADQSPRKSQKAYWMMFLNQETGVQFGTEKFAKEFNAAVVYGGIKKIKRGYYEVSYKLICEDANQTEYGFITESHTLLLEQDIMQAPQYWLWSHKRWKHQRPDDAELNCLL